jgi:serine/threonine protein kinase
MNLSDRMRNNNFNRTSTRKPSSLIGNTKVPEKKTTWTVKDFKVHDKLGKGKFGKVFRAVEKSSGKTVALKIIYKPILEQYHFFSQLRREIEIH